MRSALEGLDGVRSAEVSLEKNNAVVVFNASKVTIDTMEQAVKKAGYGVRSASKITPYKESGAGMSQAKQSDNQPQNYRTMSVAELAKVTDDPDVILVNVHIPYAGEIPGTDEFIPFNQIQQDKNELPKDKNAELVLYCRSGHMSKIAYTTLTQMGYVNVYDVPGGMNAWRQAGHTLLNKNQ